MEKIKKYLAEVKIEMKNVVWPDKKELINLTVVVIALTFILAVFVGAVDKTFVEMIIKVLK
ncbi:preprotein translocase subunit SecE [Candidatus Desantisbacteria bacterium]|nr:preprotein translocase subunit SecE [Candidatus Desantisbacteria bacterium]